MDRGQKHMRHMLIISTEADNDAVAQNSSWELALIVGKKPPSKAQSSDLPSSCGTYRLVSD